MKRIIIFYNEEKKSVRIILHRLKAWLEARNIKTVVVNSKKRIYGQFDMAIALGGDGTMLKVARTIAPLDIPLFGINLGSLGFLAEMDWQHIYPILSDVVKGQYHEDKRCMLDVAVQKKRDSKEKIYYSALNDCVIWCGGSARVIKLDVWVGKNALTTYISDGLIIATPTGSTAYSLSASGPIVHPSVDVFIITPICPHTFAQRPVIVSSQETIRVKVNEENPQDEVVVSIDGQSNVNVRPGSEIIVKRYQHDLRLILNPRENYFSILRKKMGWGKR